MNMRLPLDAMVPSLLLASCISFTLVAAEIKLPDGPIIAAWQNWGACNDTQTIQAVERGVNVVFWFSSNLVKDGDKPKISGPLPDLECVARVRKAIKEKGLPTAHLLTIGGWDAPHPDTSFTGTEWFHAWNEWNQGLPMPFDGFDWDLEGNDDLTSPYNVFSPACLQLVVDMSAAAKAAGYLVTMAPPQTYFDSTMPYFNRYLNNSNPPESEPNFIVAFDSSPSQAIPLTNKHRQIMTNHMFIIIIRIRTWMYIYIYVYYIPEATKDYHPEFRYRGRNSYAYMWAAAPPGTFDLATCPDWSKLCGGCLPGGTHSLGSRVDGWCGHSFYVLLSSVKKALLYMS